MGKTSAVNLIIHSIEERERELNINGKSRIRKFNPWQFSNSEALTHSYLSVLGRTIADSIGEDVLGEKKDLLRRLSQSGKEIVSHAVGFGAVVASGGTALPFMGAIQGGVSGAISMSEELTDTDELDSLAKRIRTSLESLDHPIVLILDDLDRIRPNELVEILSLVKTFGDLPNVIHILIYDREILDGYFANHNLPDQNPSFLQKIVQAEYDLPPPSKLGLLQLANELVSPLFRDVEESEAFASVWRVAFRCFLKSPRDVVRFYNALSVTWPAISNEAYAPDAIGIELIRLFDRPLYRKILDSRDLLLGLDFDYGEKRRKSLADQIIEGRDTELSRMICGMFPTLRQHLPHSATSRPNSISQGRPIASEAGFDTYFQMTSSPSSVSVALVEELMENIADELFLEEHFAKAAQAHSDEYLVSFFDEFLGVIEDSEALLIGTLVGFVRGAGAILSDRHDSGRSYGLFSNSQRLSIATTRILSRIDHVELIGTLGQIFEDERSNLDVCAFVLAKLGEEYELVYSDARKSLEFECPKDIIDDLTLVLSQRILARLDSGELFASKALWMLLKILSASGLCEDLPALVAEKCSSPQHAKQIAFSAMNIQTSGELGVELRMNRVPSTAVYDLVKLAELVKGHLENSDFSALEKQNLEVFVDSSQQLLDGKVPDRW